MSALWTTAWSVTGYAWLTAYLALVTGHRRVAQGLAVVAAVGSTALTVLAQATGAAPFTVSPWATSALDLLLVPAIGAFAHAAAPVRRRRWLLALLVGIVLTPLPYLAARWADGVLPYLDWPAVYGVLIVLGSVGYLAGRAVRLLPAVPRWPLALVLLAGVVLMLRSVTLLDHRGQVQGGQLVTVGLAQLAAVLAVAVPLGVLAARALRRLPAQAVAGNPAVVG